MSWHLEQHFSSADHARKAIDEIPHLSDMGKDFIKSAISLLGDREGNILYVRAVGHILGSSATYDLTVKHIRVL